MVPKRALFKDWHSNLINDIRVEKRLKKVIEFRDKYGLTLIYKLIIKKLLARVKRQTQTWNKLKITYKILLNISYVS